MKWLLLLLLVGCYGRGMLPPIAYGSDAGSPIGQFPGDVVIKAKPNVLRCSDLYIALPEKELYVNGHTPVVTFYAMKGWVWKSIDATDYLRVSRITIQKHVLAYRQTGGWGLNTTQLHFHQLDDDVSPGELLISDLYLCPKGGGK